MDIPGEAPGDPWRPPDPLGLDHRDRLPGIRLRLSRLCQSRPRGQSLVRLAVAPLPEDVGVSVQSLEVGRISLLCRLVLGEGAAEICRRKPGAPPALRVLSTWSIRGSPNRVGGRGQVPPGRVAIALGQVPARRGLALERPHEPKLSGCGKLGGRLVASKHRVTGQQLEGLSVVPERRPLIVHGNARVAVHPSLAKRLIDRGPRTLPAG